MRIQFLGATGTVTGSKFLLTEGRKNCLVDCGIFHGLKILRRRNWSPLPIKPKTIDAVLLTHAHIDHTGYVPLLVKDGFRGPIYATNATRALCHVLLPDAGHLQEEDAAYENKHRISKHSPALPLYTEEDAVESLRYLKPVPWGKKMEISRHLSFEFMPVGHILGAGFVRVISRGTRVLFSGDLGRPGGISMKPPAAPSPADYLVLESTYGNRSPPTEDPQETLRSLIVRTVQR